MSLPTLSEFIESQPKFTNNSYVRFKGFQYLYVRISTRRIDIAIVTCLDIANCNATKEKSGAFRRLVETVRKKWPYLTIYVENVLNPGFELGLMRMGFMVEKACVEPPSYYLPPCIKYYPKKNE